MKTSRMITLCLLLLLGVAVVKAEMHEFNLPDGRTLEAEIVDYDARRGLVELKRTDGKRVKIKPSIFIPDDQAYIEEWGQSLAFLSDRLLEIECNDTVVEKTKEKEIKDVTYTDGQVVKDFITTVKTIDKTAFELVFNNTSSTALSGVRMEYGIFYEQSEMAWQMKPEQVQKVFYGKTDVPALPEKSKITVLTEAVTTHEDSINPIPQAGGDQRRPGKGEVHGIRVRLYMKTPTGKEVMRELCQPETLSEKKFPWKD